MLQVRLRELRLSQEFAQGPMAAVAQEVGSMMCPRICGYKGKQVQMQDLH